jgi:hypothetical protein
LATDVSPDTTRVLYEPNKQFFTKIAFDVFQFNTSPVQSLWILEEGDDGKQYLVARYDETQENSESMKVESNWAALADSKCENVTLIYKDVPIKRFASTEYGFTKEDIHLFQKILVNKLSSDKSFVEKLIKSQPENFGKSILDRFPELV